MPVLHPQESKLTNNEAVFTNSMPTVDARGVVHQMLLDCKVRRRPNNNILSIRQKAVLKNNLLIEESKFTGSTTRRQSTRGSLSPLSQVSKCLKKPRSPQRILDAMELHRMKKALVK